MTGALLSVRPRFSRAILSGEKTVELRRRAPNCESGDVVILYETAPTMAIVGIAVVDGIDKNSPARLWQRFKHSTGMTHSEFTEYFSGLTIATAIYFRSTTVLRQPISLAEVRRIAPLFKPPQSWCYLAALPAPLMSRIGRSTGTIK